MLKQAIIPAISQHKNIKRFLRTDMEYAILMNFHLTQLKSLVQELHQEGKKVLIHIDLIKGLSSDEFGAIYLIQDLNVDGIISSKPKVIELCNKRNVMSIFRFFLKDTVSLQQSIDLAKRVNSNYVEVLPAQGKDLVEYIASEVKRPILLGGLISSKNQMEDCLNSGAIAVTVSKEELWYQN